MPINPVLETREPSDIEKCPDCNGLGKITIEGIDGKIKCQACNGLKFKECEACTNPPYTFSFSMRLCKVCLENEFIARGLRGQNVLEKAQTIDYAVKVKEDIWNAETISIADIKATIDADETVENKRYKLAEIVQARIQHYKQIIFEINEQQVDFNNKMRANQTYLNTLANELRKDEREKLKLQDIKYQPKVVKPVKTSTISKKRTINRDELKKYASELGVNESTLQMFCIAKNLTVEEAANMLRRSINESKSETRVD